MRKEVSESEEEPVNLEVARLVESGNSHSAADTATMAPDKAFFVKFFADRSRLEESGKSRPRSRKEALRRLRKGEDEQNDGEDSEAAIDDFADQLAEKMLKENDADVDIDDDDDADEHGSIESKVTGEQQGNSKKRKSSAAMDFEDFIQEEQDNEDSELDLDNFSGEEEEEDEDGETFELQAYEDESDSLVESKSQNKKIGKGKNDKGKKKKLQAADSDDDDADADFASADDYQEQMDAIIQEIQQLEGVDAADSKSKVAKSSNRDRGHGRSGSRVIGEKAKRDQRTGNKKRKSG